MMRMLAWSCWVPVVRARCCGWTKSYGCFIVGRTAVHFVGDPKIYGRRHAR